MEYDDDALYEAERELLMGQPDSLEDVEIRTEFDTLVDRYPDTPGVSRDNLLESESVSRALNFQVSQSYSTFEDEGALRNYDEMMRAHLGPTDDSDANGVRAPPRGLLGLPPLDSDSIMMKGDSGVCLWSTLERSTEAPDNVEGDDVRRQAQRIRAMAVSGASHASTTTNVTIEALLAEYHQHKPEMDALRVAGEAERKRRRIEMEVQIEQAAASVAVQEGFQFPLPSEQLWVAKYGPTTFKDLLSDEAANLKIVQWVNSWNSYVFMTPAEVQERDAARRASTQQSTSATTQSASVATLGATLSAAKKKAANLLLGDDASGKVGGGPTRPMDRILLIVGPPGVGKTTLAHVIASHCGYEAIEINASSDRSISVLESTISDAVSNAGRYAPPSGRANTATQPPHAPSFKPLQTLRRPKCLIIDEMDGIQAGVVKMLLDKDIHRPVLCLANNLYAPALRGLRSSTATIIQIPPIVAQRLVHRLEYIVGRERLDVGKGTLADLVQVSNGDVRCCLNTLQFLRRSPGERVSAHDLQRALSQLRGKDTTLGLWPLWTDTFARKDKQKYMSLLNSEFRVQWDDVVASQAAATGTRPSRVDPGFVYMSKRLTTCGDLDGLVDGLFQHYAQQRYSDYSLEKTRRCVDAFALQDLVTAHGYQHNAIGLSDKFAVVTGATCFASCSALGRGTPLSFPREGQQFREQLLRGEEAAHAFTQHASGPVAVHYNNTSTVALDVAPLVPRCLIDAVIKFPGHSFTAVRALNQVDQKLFHNSVDRHVEYGLSYVADDRPDPRRSWGGAQRDPNEPEKPHGWMIQPPLHVLGCSAHSDGGRGVAGGRGAANSKWPTKSFATPGAAKSEDDSKQKGPLIFRLRDEVKQMLVGEISQAKIRRHAAHFVPPPPPRPAPTTAKPADAVVPVHKNEMLPPAPVPVPAPVAAPTPVSEGKRTPMKRDFFGRPIAKAPPAAPPLPPQLGTPEKAPPRQAQAAAAASGKLPPTHDVKYVYFDGSTNAVKLPAQLSDF